ncbi:hypothetical protein Tco_0963883 [Tanacetum coccineum]
MADIVYNVIGFLQDVLPTNLLKCLGLFSPVTPRWPVPFAPSTFQDHRVSLSDQDEVKSNLEVVLSTIEETPSITPVETGTNIA